MTIAELTKHARFIFKELGIVRSVRVRELKKGFPWYWTTYGLLTNDKHGNYNVWMRRCNPKGRMYCKRFLLSILAHELAHVWHIRHTQRFTKSQRKVTLMLKKYEND